jgi:hypothetical protein
MFGDRSTRLIDSAAEFVTTTRRRRRTETAGAEARTATWFPSYDEESIHHPAALGESSSSQKFCGSQMQIEGRGVHTHLR